MTQSRLKAILLAIVITPNLVLAQNPGNPPRVPSPYPDANAPATVEEDGGDEQIEDGKQTPPETLRGMEVVDGLFRFYKSQEHDKALIEIRPDQLDTDYLYTSTIQQATGERGLYGSSMDLNENFVVQWRRLGNRIQLVRTNQQFRAKPHTPIARAIKNSFSDSVLGSGTIRSTSNQASSAILVDLHEIFFSTDFTGIASRISRSYELSYSLARSDSGIVLLRSFPKNSQVGILARFRTNEEKDSSMTVPDPSSLTMQIHYSFVQLPDKPFLPRLGDDRVGHFYNSHMDFSTDRDDSPIVRYVRRWNLRKSDPAAALSEPESPIVFWIENTVPVRYRGWVRDAILMWIPAFERLGFKDALVVRQQPDDAEWIAADVRYNTVRWLVTFDDTSARGPSHSNPYTGQLIAADVSIAESVVRLAGRKHYESLIHPVKRSGDLRSVAMAAPDSAVDCDVAAHVFDITTLGYHVLSARPGWNVLDEERFTKQFFQWIVAHEIGHTLGLRHNFRASTAERMDPLAESQPIPTVHSTASIMDYLPPVVALRDEEQGDYFPTQIGPYDEWAIEYAYKPIPGADTPDAELPELRSIASRASDPILAYATDEDVFPLSRALDPRDNANDHTSQPLAWYERQFKLVDEVWSQMESRVLRDGESYAPLRSIFDATLGVYRNGAHVAMKYLGGIYHHRDHVGDGGGRVPFQPVPAADQRKALEFLSLEIWAPDAFDVQSALLARLQSQRFPDFDGRKWAGIPSKSKRLDYPIHDRVLEIQAEVLDQLYNPLKLRRFQDLELLQADEHRFLMTDVFEGVRKSIWYELNEQSNISSFRRNLQSEHLSRLITLVTQAAEGVPRDAVSLARSDISELRAGIDHALRSGELDRITRAHLEDALVRVRQVIEGQLDL